jgi:hypothetical protein
MANKQDLKDAMSVEELTQTLALHAIKRHDWHIQARCSLCMHAWRFLSSLACAALSVSVHACLLLPAGAPMSQLCKVQLQQSPAPAVEAWVSSLLKLHVGMLLQATCAKTGDGLLDGMEWIAQRVQGGAKEDAPPAAAAAAAAAGTPPLSSARPAAARATA